MNMGNSPEVREFLMSRRSKVTPQQAGLPAFGNRRVPGLRRVEAAALAGVSVEYYTRLERGNLQGVSDAILHSIANALQLDDTERGHLYHLARAANASPARAPRRPAKVAVQPIVQRIVDAMPTVPAFVQNNRFDILYSNALGRALYSELYADISSRANTARFVFFSPAARRFYVDWDRVARGAVGQLRVEVGRNPYDTDLSNLIGELSTRSEDFRVMWGAYDVHVFRDGEKAFHHPNVGAMTLEHAAMTVPGENPQMVTVYSAVPGSGADDALKMLASWAATTTAVVDAEPSTS
jgi:hypothetical protein